VNRPFRLSLSDIGPGGSSAAVTDHRRKIERRAGGILL
jgi:hypothetical protein